MADVSYSKPELDSTIPGRDPFEITYWADRFGLPADKVAEALSQSCVPHLDDSYFDGLE